MTLLQKYFQKGWLKFGNRQISAQDRLNAGNRFYADFYKAGIVDLRIPNLEKPRVDGGNSKDTPDFVLEARERFNKAVLSLNPEQSFVLWQIVCLDKPVHLAKNNNYRHSIEVLKEEICKSLDVLFCHYWGKPETQNPHKIVSMISEEAKNDFEKWLKSICYEKK